MKGEKAIPARGGELLDVLLTRQEPYYLQGDARWADVRIGGSGERIGSVGCALCSVAMGLGALGLGMDPGTLNAALVREKGYTGQGWLIWSAVGRVTGGKVEAVVENAPSLDVLDGCLRSRWYPLVKFFLPGDIPHWVLVVGKEGDEYLVKDPGLAGGGVVTALSGRATGIWAVRYLRRMEL